ncbi:ParA family protein [Pseudoxanthomonas taiwanensis]|uniref:Chromosome partitioning protein n=1 Tax=Pseudoxanthomonas taiwanensis J19 TaxID=935569 RepID=A0A562DKA4_9GAMM|nr:ParA family protein [Pseudoxanthomonas taiwanensis]TWH09994.1 chromosome partitioning protein [Pseudoxanthomonas taiwanensis J19]
MKTILVAGSKGGVGKTTIATHLAAHAALQGRRTVLADADPQGSATRWAQRRAALDSAVLPVDASTRRGWEADLERFLERADAVVVPLQPSALDIEATVAFLNTLAKVPRVHARRLPVGLVLNRSKPWTNTSQQAVQMLSDWPYPLVAQLRDTQAYTVLVGLGRSLFDYHSAQVRDHQGDWEPLLQWLDQA